MLTALGAIRNKAFIALSSYAAAQMLVFHDMFHGNCRRISGVQQYLFNQIFTSNSSPTELLAKVYPMRCGDCAETNKFRYLRIKYACASIASGAEGRVCPQVGMLPSQQWGRKARGSDSS